MMKHCAIVHMGACSVSMSSLWWHKPLSLEDHRSTSREWSGHGLFHKRNRGVHPCMGVRWACVRQRATSEQVCAFGRHGASSFVAMVRCSCSVSFSTIACAPAGTSTRAQLAAYASIRRLTLACSVITLRRLLSSARGDRPRDDSNDDPWEVLRYVVRHCRVKGRNALLV